MGNIKLPIDSHIDEIVRCLEKPEKIPNLILKASPGSGKTTRVPPALLRAARASGSVRADQEILVLEPRRLAAKYAARRVAEEFGATLGGLIGYQFRFENVTSVATRLRFLTEGMLMRRLLSDPTLNGVSTVILDEFHERHLHTDIAIAYLRNLQTTRRPELRIVVMSATLETEAISEFLGQCPVLKIDAPVFPVRQLHLPAAPAKRLDLTVRDAVLQILEEPETQGGDTLVFLPGMADIRRSDEALRPLAARAGLSVLPLHGELSREEQDRALLKSKNRKVILATNVAETSLTIEGVTAVIDSGLHRQASFSWWSGVPSLKTRSISRASAIQRAGRAGRTSPGVCLRLYTRGDFDSRPAFDLPEISRADISQTVLELKAIGVADVFAFSWFERPSQTAFEGALTLLHRLGAIENPTPDAKLTPLGRNIAGLPAHPRIARVLVEADSNGVLAEAAAVCATLSEAELPLDAFSLTPDRLDPSAHRARDQYLNAVKSRLGSAQQRVQSRLGSADSLARSFLAGFPDRVARKRSFATSSTRGAAHEAELLLSSGGSARVEASGVVSEGDTFVVLDIQEQKAQGQARSQLKVRSLGVIQPEWLFDVTPPLIAEKQEISWDSDRKRVTSVLKMVYDQLTLTESDSSPSDSPEGRESCAAVLMKNTIGIDPKAQVGPTSLQDWATAMAPVAGAEEIEAIIARIGLASPSVLTPEYLARQIPQLFLDKTTLEEVRATDWSSALCSLVPGLDPARLERFVPSHLTLNKGRRAKVHYKLGQPPWLESRLQDFFGMKKGPALLEGRLPVTLHLLAPNQRAVQVTSDLEGFWERAYPEIRKELSRRYPKHAWPLDPMEK